MTRTLRLCTGGLPELVNSELRIDKPYIRESFLRDREKSRHRRGSDRFVAVPWEEALSIVEAELRRVKADLGNEAIYGVQLCQRPT